MLRKKIDCILFGYTTYWLVFNQFCESIDRYNQKSVTTPGSWERPRMSVPHVVNDQDKGIMFNA
jgi:hypothetical protein